MRNFAAALMTATLLAGNALAADSVLPLPAGKPAGLRPAQDDSNDTIFYIVGLGAIGAGIAILASGNSNGSTVATAPTTTQ